MVRLLFVASFLFMGLASPELLAQNRTRPTVPVPNGFEVNSYTGNLYHRRTDVSILAQGMPIDVTFSYNVSRRSRNWGLGKGWTFTYNMAYYPDPKGIWVEQADGRRDFYLKAGASYNSPTGIYDVLREYESGKFYVETKEGLRYYFDNSRHKRLTRMQDLDGNQINLAYSDTLLQSLTHSSGHTLQFTWTQGRLATIEDRTCSPERKLTYEYDQDGNPSKVTNPIGDYVRYYADTSARITGYTDEGGNNMSFLYNRNGAVSRVISCATSHTFSYLSRQFKTFVAEQVNGQNVVTTYTFDEKGRVTEKNGNCCGYHLEYGYDANNNIIRLTDGNKKATLYAYDARGNVLKETDPAGHVTSYTYDPVLNRVTSITDKKSNKTTYTYDAKGHLLTISKPLGSTEKSTYDAKGNRQSYTNANNATASYTYNAAGLLTQTTDPEGGIRTFTYDCYGNLLTETDANENQTSYAYNALNQRIKMTDALGQVTTYTYNKLRLLESEKNALGKTTRYEYDGLGRRIKTTFPMGNSTLSEYDGQGNLIRETDSRGSVTQYSYNSRKQPLSITDGLGHTVFYEYDGAGNKTSETDKNGNITRFTYDDLYRLIKVTDALSGVTTYSYDAMGNRIAEIDPNGNTTTYQYDALQRLVKTTDPFQKSEEYAYDAVGNRLSVKDKTDRITAATYDKLNRRKTLTDALGGVTTFTYDAMGNRASEKDPLNRTTTYNYDALGRLMRVTNPLNEVTAYTYDALGNEKTVTHPNGKLETHTYDDNSQLLATTDQLGAIIAYTYDANGNVLTEKDGNGNSTSFQYDANDRLIKTTFPNQTTIQRAYDANGNKIKEIDQKGNVTLLVYDKLNRTTTLTDPLGHPNRFVYDAKGNLVNILDAKGNATSYTYDARNQVALQTYADGSTKRFAYDAAGRLIEKTTGNGTKIQYTYDALGRMTERQYPGNVKETLTYDATGFLTKAANANAIITLSYDAAGRLLKEDNNGKATTYTHNPSGKTKTITYPGGTKIEWTLDVRDRLLDIKKNGASLAGLQYDGADRLMKKTFQNGTSASYSYDKMNNLLSLTATPASQLNLRYQYDAADQRTLTERVHKPTRSEQYGYDANFQLISAKVGQYSNNQLSPNLNFQYTYDALGNRTKAVEGSTEKTYSSNYVNQYTAINTNGSNAPPVYDRNGNLLSDGLNTYTYDFENRVTSIQKGTDRITYAYDALGRRISRTQNGMTTQYYYDLDQVIEEVTGTSTKTYVYRDGIDQILYSNTAGKDYFYQTDDLNTVQSITDGSGNLLEYYTYDPFGTPHVFSPADVELAASSINNLLYTGRPYEFAFKTYHYRNRELNPILGRFAQRDPLEYIDGLNNYAYVNNNTINATDPLGTIRVSQAIASGIGIVGNIGGIVGGIGLASTGGGLILGGAILVNSTYGLAANLANFWNAVNDSEGPSTGALFNDIARKINPCSEFLQGVATGADLALNLGGLAIARKAANIAAKSSLKPLGLGSTGRTEPVNLTEKLAMEEIMSNPKLGNKVMEGLKDERWLGWDKMQYTHTSLDGTKTTIHYVGKIENGVLKAVDDFKFK
ncbi:hypothetical protein BWI97_13925 [Siphonobacter sp. BAB-5405]|uniref:RHS repeat-associated core domain-containing protein n=1 Tax=Siphonobacter sp. BAB-5405 TaxID=1864825 RepID=UPI000C809818|nr:RHS repeat-associated core domain-containing protein [Siphonobacter sp. BAB-5405]PMD95694.1 hypothetical protein BWI97_13925 [Siphonobacter sp. BAB-5405]